AFYQTKLTAGLPLLARRVGAKRRGGGSKKYCGDRTTTPSAPFGRVHPSWPGGAICSHFDLLHFGSGSLEQGSRAGELIGGVSSRDLGTDSCLSHRHDGKRKADDIHALLQKVFRHTTGPCRITDHHRNDWMFSGNDIETKFRHPHSKELRVLVKTHQQVR